MHLARLQLNPQRRQARFLLGSAQAMHAAVLASFPQPDEARGRVLWRVDRDAHQVQLYVASRPPPDFSHLVEQAGWQTTQDTWAVRDYKPVLARLAQGQRWAFRLTANPSHVSEGKRYGHVTVAQQLEWFSSRVSRWGIGPDPEVIIRNRGVDRFRRGGATVTVAKATYDGILTVGDPELLRTAMTDGIGRAKAYGCGLLTLASP